MNVTEIEYSRKFNLGNYETEEIGLTANLEGLEDISEAFRELKQTVFGLQAEGVDAEPPRTTQTTGTLQNGLTELAKRRERRKSEP